MGDRGGMNRLYVFLITWPRRHASIAPTRELIRGESLPVDPGPEEHNQNDTAQENATQNLECAPHDLAVCAAPVDEDYTTGFFWLGHLPHLRQYLEHFLGALEMAVLGMGYADT